MEAARLPSAAPRRGLIQIGLVTGLVGLAAAAWLLTDARMSEMAMEPGLELGGFAFFIVTWVVMMAAMMFPSVAPVVLTYERIQIGRQARGAAAVPVSTAFLLAGYLLAWSLAGATAYLVFSALGALELGTASWVPSDSYLVGGVILAAALYQLTPLKHVCLRHCRNPLGFLLHRWRPGAQGALLMGVEHGAFCVGCCWMLMAALFALGWMSLGWMALIAGLIAVEKLLPWRRVASYGVAVLLAVLGLAVTFATEDVPGLMIDDASAPMMDAPAMDAMDAHPAAMR